MFESDHLLHYHHSEQIYGQLLEQSPASVKWRSAVLLAGKLQRSFHWLIYICHHSECVVYLSRADMSSLHFCLQFIISSYFLPVHFAWRIVNTAMLPVEVFLLVQTSKVINVQWFKTEKSNREIQIRVCLTFFPTFSSTCVLFRAVPVGLMLCFKVWLCNAVWMKINANCWIPTLLHFQILHSCVFLSVMPLDRYKVRTC